MMNNDNKPKPEKSHRQMIAMAKNKARNFKTSYSKDVVKMARRTNGNAV